MKTIIILAHPNIEQSVVNKTWIEALAKSNPEIKVHNIYQKYPNWNIDVSAEQALLEQYDRIIFQYPLQWYSVTPLLKKWLDDVLAYGWAYGGDQYKLAGKKIGAAISTGGVESAYTKDGYGTIDEFAKPIEATARFVKAEYDSLHVFHGSLSPDAKERLTENVNKYLEYIL